MLHKMEHLHICYQNLAGGESRAGNPLLADFILLAEKLEQLGFIYCNGKVVIL